MKPVAVQGMAIVPVEQGVTLTGVVVSTPPSSYVFVDGKGVYSGDITVNVASASFNSYTATGLTFTLHPTAEYVLSDGSEALLEGDTSDTVSAQGYNPSLSPPEITFPVTLKVDSAGQSVMNAE